MLRARRGASAGADASRACTHMHCMLQRGKRRPLSVRAEGGPALPMSLSLRSVRADPSRGCASCTLSDCSRGTSRTALDTQCGAVRVWAVCVWLEAVRMWVEAARMWVEAARVLLEAARVLLEAVRVWVEAVHVWVEAVHVWVDAARAACCAGVCRLVSRAPHAPHG
jgi:hypothetical protein